MRIRTMVGLAVAGTAAPAAVVGGVIAAAADEEPIVWIVTQEPSAENAVQPERPQDRADCPDKNTTANTTATSEAGL